jgi:DNA-binding XRE family transcriptional regulator
MMSKAELARKAGLSTLTIDRVEAGRACRLDTKRKILLALGMKISDKATVFGAAVAARDNRLNPNDSHSSQIAPQLSRPASARTNPIQGRSQADGGYES